MSSFVDFLKSGNIEVAVNRIATCFSDNSYDYTLTFNEITKEMASNADSAKNSHFIELIIDNNIRNLGELTCLYLNTFTEPKNTSLNQTLDDFEEDVRQHLIREGVLEEYISGDNAHLTSQSSSLFPNLTNEQAWAAREAQDQYKNKETKHGLKKYLVISLTIILTLSLAFLFTHLTNQQSSKRSHQLGKPEQLELKALAKSGDLKSQHRLGLAYEKGNGVQQDYEEAVKWYRKAAEEDYPPAQHGLGTMYYNGLGVPRNYEKAFKWYHKGAENGRKYSQFNLGVQYYHGRGVIENKELAAHWYHKSALQGITQAQFNLGLQYLQGQGVVKNAETADYWIRKAATQGLAQAQLYLGYEYRRRNARLPKERRETNNYTQSVYWFRKAAEQGDVEGQYLLSQMDSTRYGAVISEKEALKWLKKAAEQGHKRAQLSLGYLYDEGRGLPKRDDKLATYWYRKAAEQGYSPAQNELGERYAKGLGVAQSDDQAAYWFRKAIEQGNPEAERRLKRLLGN